MNDPVLWEKEVKSEEELGDLPFRTHPPRLLKSSFAAVDLADLQRIKDFLNQNDAVQEVQFWYLLTVMSPGIRVYTKGPKIRGTLWGPYFSPEGMVEGEMPEATITITVTQKDEK